MPYGGYSKLDFRDAGNGWVYSFYSNALYLGKMENGKLDGPGFMFATQYFEQGCSKMGNWFLV